MPDSAVVSIPVADLVRIQELLVRLLAKHGPAMGNRNRGELEAAYQKLGVCLQRYRMAGD